MTFSVLKNQTCFGEPVLKFVLNFWGASVGGFRKKHQAPLRFRPTSGRGSGKTFTTKQAQQGHSSFLRHRTIQRQVTGTFLIIRSCLGPSVYIGGVDERRKRVEVFETARGFSRRPCPIRRASNPFIATKDWVPLLPTGAESES